MFQIAKNLYRNTTAQDLAEYGIALAVIAAGAALAAVAISGYVGTLWDTASGVISGAAAV